MSGMRRLFPWVLLGLLTVGAAAGIALGVANQPGPTPQQWLASAGAATDRAGTFRVSVREVISSSNPQLHSTMTTSGLFDFTHDEAQESMVNRFSFGGGGPFGLGTPAAMTERTTFVVHGKDLYVGADTTQSGTGTGRSVQWAEEIAPRNAPSFLGLDGAPATSDIPFGIDGLSQVTALRDVGPATVGGASTTKYSLSIASTGCPSSKGSASFTTVDSPELVWVDRAGRIVEERSVVREVPPPVRPQQQQAGSGATTSRGQFQVHQFAPGTSTASTTVRFSDFGAPVSIKVPRVFLRNVQHFSASVASRHAELCPTYSLEEGRLSGSHEQLHVSKTLHEEPVLKGARRPPR